VSRHATLTLLVVTCFLVACTHKSHAAPSGVTITGRVWQISGGCGFGAADRLNTIGLTVFDQSGTVIATGKTNGDGTCQQMGGHSELNVTYAIKAPAASFYKIQVDAHPGDPAFENAAPCSATTISRADLDIPDKTVALFAGNTNIDLLSGVAPPPCQEG
jgi:hypothetical protein